MNPARLGWMGWAVIVVLLLSMGLFLPGCASERYLTEEQDAAMREACEKHGGCTVLPAPVWEQIKDILRSIAGGQSS